MDITRAVQQHVYWWQLFWLPICKSGCRFDDSVCWPS